MKIPAHAVKPGDKIGTVEVFDIVRRTFGGFYIPMTAGSRDWVRSLAQIVTID